MLTLSKAAIFGSAAIALLCFMVFRGDEVRKAVVYVGALVASFVTYSLLFPGVVQLFLSPQVILVSLMARAFDLFATIGFDYGIETITSHAGDKTTAGAAILDAMRAFAIVTMERNEAYKVDLQSLPLDYGGLGSLTLFSQMLREPLLSAVIVFVGVAVALALNVPRRRLEIGAVDLASMLSVLAIASVTAAASVQLFWLYFGVSTVALYGSLTVKRPES
jgi:hypothetical protein